jgi:hypothetical protein
MDYNLTDFPKEEFLRLWDLVLVAREGITVPQKTAALSRVSERIEDFSETDRPAISKPGFEGMYYFDGQIWFKPGQSFRDKQDTALHELAHHEVPHEAHGSTWRKVFGIALVFHLRECGYEWDRIVHEIRYQVVQPNYRQRDLTARKKANQTMQSEVDRIVRLAQDKMHILTERGER